MIAGLLERFGGYTYTTLLQERAELLRVLAIEEMGGSRDAERS